MHRAVISIGVATTGQLPVLQAAVTSATEVSQWARSQGIPAKHVKLITDAKKRVTRDQVFQAVSGLVNLGYIEQLIVYFSGHGINSGQGEQWLLSDAPVDAAAAVNVRGSEFAARFAGFNHVTFISDACRTAADDIQALRVVGGDIFPNPDASGEERPVDQFFATRIGNPAFEVKSVKLSAGAYRAVYTTVMLEALNGKVPSIIEPHAGAAFVRPRPLRKHLATAVPALFSKLKVKVSSQPEARIESDPDAWLATLPHSSGTPPPPGPRKRRARRPGQPALIDDWLTALDVEGEALAPDVLEDEASARLSSALDPRRPASRKRRRGAARGAGGSEAEAALDYRLARGITAFGPDHFETECGIKVRGARMQSCLARDQQASLGASRDVVQVNLRARVPGANVLLTMDDGSLVMAPAIRGYITGLSFDELGELDDVWCEPSANTPRGEAYLQQAAEIRTLRAVIAASSSLGVFRIGEDATGQELLGRLREVKGLDPALAVYAAYGFHDRRMRDAIVDMQRFLDRELGVRIFDVAMLSFAMSRKPAHDGPRDVLPAVPMLTQGWALLSPLRIRLPRDLDRLRGSLRSSLFTHFRPDARDSLVGLLQSGEVL